MPTEDNERAKRINSRPAFVVARLILFLSFFPAGLLFIVGAGATDGGLVALYFALGAITLGLGVAIFIVGALLASSQVKRDEHLIKSLHPEDTREIIPCPICGEHILAIAKKCKHCGEFVASP